MVESQRKIRKYENQCVCYHEGIGYFGSACPYMNVSVDYCDICRDEGAKYRIDDKDYCMDCAKKYLQEVFDDLTISEKAEVLEVDLDKLMIWMADL